MKILKFPDTNLLKKCNEVCIFDKELIIILDQMYKTMIGHNGLGLAANQCGLDASMFVMVTSTGLRLNVINPSIIAKSNEILDIKEGCLSAKGEFLVTGNRPKWIQVRYQDETGAQQMKLLYGINSVVYSHEFDHTLGKAFFQAETLPKGLRRKIEKKWGLR